jgi:hypothetical protein
MPATATYKLAPSGKGILISLANAADDTDAILQAIHAVPTFRGGDGASLATANPIWGPNDSGSGPGSGGAPYLTWAYIPLLSQVAEGQSLFATAPDGAFGTSAGLTPALSSALVESLLGGTFLPPFDTSTRRNTRVGWNVAPAAADDDGHPVKCNYVTRIVGWSGAATLTPNGFPASFTGQGYAQASVANCPTNSVDDKGRPNCPAAVDWVLSYDKPPGSYVLDANGPGDTCTFDPATDRTIIAGVTYDRYAITSGGVLYSPNILVSTNVAGDCALGIYPADVPTDGSQTYHPAWLRLHQGADTLRYVTAIDFGGGGMIGKFSDFRPSTHLSDSMATRTVGGTIASIAPGSDPTGWIGAQVPIAVTFAAPHGINNGMYIPITINGNFRDTNGNAVAIYGLQWARVASETQLMVAGQYAGQPANPSFVLAQSYANDGTWSCFKEITPGICWQDAVDRCNAVRANLWICVPCGLDDDGCRQLFAGIAARLAPGLKLYVEYSNETWNDRFASHVYCQNLSYSLGLDWQQASVIRSGQVHAIAEQQLAQLGRAGDLVRVFGSQAGNAGLTARTLQLCVQYGLPCDALAIAPYIDNGPAAAIPEPTMIAGWGALDDEQRMDLSERYIQCGWDVLIKPHRDAIDASPLAGTTQLVCYEGGPQQGPSIGATQVPLTDAQKAVHCSWSWVRNRRFWGIMLYILQMCEDNRVSLFNIFQSTGPKDGFNANTGNVWTACPALGIVPGRGDGSDGLADNHRIGPGGLPFEDYRNMVSVEMGAVEYWRSIGGGVAPQGNHPASRLARWRLGFRRRAA